MPLQRRVPKRGFNNIFAKQYVTVNVSDLEARFEAGAEIDTKAIVASGLVKNPRDGIKVLANGEVTKAFTITVADASKAAIEKIAACGGSLTTLKKKD